jgi:hypothetical protein
MPAVKSNDIWLSRLVPFGLIGQTGPHHYREMVGVLWENKGALGYAWYAASRLAGGKLAHLPPR